MAAKKKTAEKVTSVDLATGESKTVLVYRATKPLTQAQFDLAASMLQNEHAKAGVAVVLIPFSVEPAGTKEGADNGNTAGSETGAEDNK